MSYIILNGENSNNITGLLIQTLPPVTLPQVRTTIETVDGRDGDIVTKLGYSAYDKTFSIGLHGSYDVDQIIEYFASEGTVVFSNEPDKYYKYQTLQQIDFTKLLRFKQASVKLHCQPFKYEVNETPVTSTGSSATVENAGNVYSKPKITLTGSGTVELKLNGTTIFSIDLGVSSTTIIIDIDEMNSYDTNGNLMNRAVTGDYSSFVLLAGSNTVAWTGTVSSVSIENYSRWL